MRLGSRYGGWWVPEAAIRSDAVAYCVGAGEDITFDLELLNRGLIVRTADPTPRAIEHVMRQGIVDERFAFRPVGLWDRNSTVRLYSPKNPQHVSHSILNLQATETWIDASVVDLPTLRELFGDDHIDILKLDIEGAEYAVIEALSKESILPSVLCVDFDQPQPFSSSRAAAKMLEALGYRIRTVEGYDVLFVRSI